MDRGGSSNDVSVSVENIAGIEKMALSFSPGVTLLTGKNATNRTSLLQSLMAVLGSDDVSLKSDADRGEVTLSLDGESYSRTLRREDGRVQLSGDPYIADSELGDLFAFLLESNEARQAVRLGSNLRELVMRPVDTAAIRAEIERLEAEKRRLDEELAALASLEDDLPALEERKQHLESSIAEQEAELEQRESALAELDASIADSKATQEQLDTKLSELETTRSELGRKRTQLETEEASIESLQAEREDIESRRADLTTETDNRLDEIGSELDRIREHKRSLDTTINQLGQVIQFNESVIDGDTEPVMETLETEHDQTAVTQQLLTDETAIVCWTCGSEVEQSSITNTLETLRSLRQQKVTERRECQSDIDDLQDEKRTLESTRSERERLQERIEDIESEITQREDTVLELRTDISSLKSRIGELEEAVKERENRENEEVLERHRKVNEAQFELNSLREDLADTVAEIDQVEAELDRRSELASRREAVAEELTAQRTQIDRLEADVVEIFNEEMDAVLSLLAYENIERIWIERREEETRNGQQTDIGGVLDLHIVRDSASGVAYKDSIENLSESEREVAGLVFALAGYLAHEVYESVPFMLLDSLEAIDSDRIADLIAYLGDYAPNLVVALLESDAAAVDANYDRIEMGQSAGVSQQSG